LGPANGSELIDGDRGVAGMALSDWLARHRAVVWVSAVFLGPVVAGVLTLVRPQLHENHVTLLLVLAVAVVSAVGMRPAGLVAAVTTGLAYDYFWTEPFYSFRIFDTQDILTVLLLVLVGGAVERLSWWGGRQRAVAARRLDYLTALRHAAEPIRPEAHAATLEAISNTINTVLDADLCRLVRRSLTGHGASWRRQRHPSWPGHGRRHRRAADR
jgi:K+-sensing histidine kinase KdpD